MLVHKFIMRHDTLIDLFDTIRGLVNFDIGGAWLRL